MSQHSDIYLMDRDSYRSFVEQIKPTARRIETVQLTSTTEAVKIYSKKTGKCLCSRVSSTEEGVPERYYIFDMPDDDERCEAQRVYRLNLKSREEVQAFFTALSKIQKEHEKNV